VDAGVSFPAGEDLPFLGHEQHLWQYFIYNAASKMSICSSDFILPPVGVDLYSLGSMKAMLCYTMVHMMKFAKSVGFPYYLTIYLSIFMDTILMHYFIWRGAALHFVLLSLRSGTLKTI